MNERTNDRASTVTLAHAPRVNKALESNTDTYAHVHIHTHSHTHTHTHTHMHTNSHTLTHTHSHHTHTHTHHVSPLQPICRFVHVLPHSQQYQY